jgi:hypothetical protein
MIDDRERELEAFKSDIDLRDYAGGMGYDIDGRTTSRNSAALAHPDGDKIIVGMGGDRHYVYFSVRDPADKGSIIDFDQRRKGGSLGEVRKRLRPWLAPGGSGTSSPPSVMASRTPACSSYGRLEPVVTDLDAVRDAYAATEGLTSTSAAFRYLTERRGLPAALLASDRFNRRIRGDERGNAVFPHWNVSVSGGKQLCGFEKKNDGFTGFASGGIKGLWTSSATEHDRRMVIAETAIDALSYAALFGFDDARFFSIAGQMNPEQPGLLHRAIRAMPTGSEIILAVDHDDGGRSIAEYIRPIFEHIEGTLGRHDLTLTVHHPPTPGTDWNDKIRGDRHGARSTPEDPAPA